MCEVQDNSEQSGVEQGGPSTCSTSHSLTRICSPNLYLQWVSKELQKKRVKNEAEKNIKIKDVEEDGN